jgi:endonuclease/exonuclease/phosphatase family metal-dependent hydrolase
MRILSLNAWGGRLHESLIPYLEGADADVVCLQEIVHTPGSTAEWLDYRDGDRELLQRANLFREIAAVLPNHLGIFCAAACGDLFNGETPVPSQWGLATFVRDTVPVVAQAQDFVHGEFSPNGWGEHPRSRNAHAIRLAAAAGTVTIAHMHGLRDLDGKHDTPAREAQARQLVDMIKRTRRHGDKLVVCGDFNVLPGSATFATLAEIGLTDLVTTRGYTDTRTSHYAKQQRFADYMLVSADVDVRCFEIVREPEVSDHCALLLDFG